MTRFLASVRVPLVLVALAVLGLALPARAGADRLLEVSIMDDTQLLGRSQEQIDSRMAQFQRLGVDRVRVSAFWNGAAPEPDSRTKPAGFDSADPADPRYRWDALDRVVSSAAAHGLRIMLSITTPAPMWATTGARRNQVWHPSAGEFGAFAQAVATRYGAIVDHYGISNEPNQGGWLQPQSDSRGRLISPVMYRSMVRAAYPRIKAADPSSVVLIGNLASGGSSKRGRRSPVRPLAFLRAMACVDRRYRPVRSGSCRGYRPLPADAVGHHPYQFFTPPTRRSRNPDDATIGDGRRLLRALDRLVRAGAIAPQRGRRLAVFYTEFGYQTNPPDPFAGISLARQNRWLQEAAYVAWRTPRIRGLNQFLLVDRPVRGRGFAAYREFQSGLLFASGRRKPAYGTFRNPFAIHGSRFWGQVRPGGAHVVALQYRPGRRGSFRTVKTVRTTGLGYFSVRLRRRRGQWRFAYSDGPVGRSQALTVH